MISFFTLASDDQSVFYLSQLFGSVGTVLVPSSGNTTFKIMSVIFSSLNTTALIIGAIIVTYTTIAGLVKTAAEGEFLGKQWSSMWVPFRMVIGIASLFPTAGGYSVLQIIMMWVIIQGVAAADSLWTVVLNFVNAFGSPYSSVQLPTTVGVSQSIGALFSALVCEDTLKADSDTPQKTSNGNQVNYYTASYSDQSGNHNFYYCADNQGNAFCDNQTLGQAITEKAGVVSQPNSGSQNVNPDALSSVASQRCVPNGNNSIRCLFGPPTSPTTGACGSMIFGDASGVCKTGSTDITSTLQCAGYKAQQTAIAWIVDVLYNAAHQFVQLDNQYLQFSNNLTVAPQFVANYCQQNGISPAACSFVMTRFGGSTTLPAATSDDNSGASDTLVKNILWPCYMESVVSGAASGTCIQGTPNNSIDFIGTNTTYYQNAINTGIANAMMQYLSNSQNLASNSTWQQAQSTGWILAGAYYYQIASANGKTTNLSIPPFAVQGPNVQGGNNSNPAANYRNNVSASQTLMNQISTQTQDPSSPTASISGFSQVSGSMGSIAQSIWNAFSGALTGNSNGQTTNPLVAMAGFGETLINIATITFATSMAIMTIVLGVTAYLGDPMVLGTGSPTNGALEAAKFLFMGTWTIIAAFMGWCFTFGGTLGIYTPLIPYILFVSGAVGWFISVIEAMVAAPFVALGILSPSGHHEILGKADAGLMILFGTFLRPTLMIVGMMSAMLLAPVAISLINSGFEGVMHSINSSPGIYELIIFITAYTTLIITIMNKTFALIHIVPDRVLTWIGGPAGSAGSDAGDVTGAVKSATSAAGETAAGAAKGGIEGGLGLAKAQASGQHAKKAQDAQAESATQGAERHDDMMKALGGENNAAKNATARENKGKGEGKFYNK